MLIITDFVICFIGPVIVAGDLGNRDAQLAVTNDHEVTKLHLAEHTPQAPATLAGVGEAWIRALNRRPNVGGTARLCLAKVTDRTKVVFLANPNNPTGTYLPFDEVKRLHSGLPPHVLLVLDAAYAEYVRRNDYASGLELVATSENVVMTRTFSKIHGLASLRLGWMVGPAHVIDVVNRIRGPFNVNGPALVAGIAAIEDDAHVAASVSHNDTWLAFLTREIEALGLRVTPSVGNFLLVHFSNEPGRTARDADVFLTSRGLVLRRVDSYGIPGALRLTVGTEEANHLVVSALREFLAGVQPHA